MLDPRSIKTGADARKIVEERGLSHIKVGLFDIDGVMRGKYLSKDKFFSSLDNGFAFCDVVLGWDSNDRLYDNVSYTGWHTGYPDAPVRIVASSCRCLPFEGEMLLFIVEFDGEAEKLCPRGLLRRTIARASDMGLNVSAAFEYEFFMFNETPESVRAKNYRNLTPMTPGAFGYSILRNSVHAGKYHDLLKLCEEMDMPLEALHTETGPGVIEAALVHDNASDAADKAALFKTFTKVWAQRNEMMATFMAKWSEDQPGQSGHIHISLQSKDGKSAFFDAGGEHTMSVIQRQFLAGQQRLMPEFLAMTAPTVNSYTRMVPGLWAPLDATWGVDNRTTALRVISGSEQSQRIEYRLGAADANPHIALAAALASGLYGIEHELEPAPPVTGNAYEQEHPTEYSLPASLFEAAGRLRQSQAANELFGQEFVQHYAATREWEEREFRKHVTDWELSRYFEII